MDAINLLKQDHRMLIDMFEQFEKASDKPARTRQSLAEKLNTELVRHMHIEEQLFYPMARERLDERDKEHVIEALEEHHMVKVGVKELQGMSPDDERFHAKVKVAKDMFEHHRDEEEKQLFPMVQKKISGEELDHLGQELESMKKEVSLSPDPYGPDVPRARRAATRAQSRITTGRAIAARTSKPAGKTTKAAGKKAAGKTAAKKTSARGRSPRKRW